MSEELKATGDYYYGDMYRWQVRIEDDGRQWIHPETRAGVDTWVPTSHDWVLPRRVVLVRTDTLDALRAKWESVPWDDIRDATAGDADAEERVRQWWLANRPTAANAPKGEPQP